MLPLPVALAIYLASLYAIFVLAALRLSTLAGEAAGWRAAIPIGNIYTTHRLLGLRPSEATLFVLVMLPFPIGAALLLVRLAGQVASKSGRHVLWGLVALPPVSFIGLAALILTARRLEYTEPDWPSPGPYFLARWVQVFFTMVIFAFPPLGIWLMWNRLPWRQRTKWVLSVVAPTLWILVFFWAWGHFVVSNGEASRPSAVGMVTHPLTLSTQGMHLEAR
jgi:hypothetical protein